MDNRIQKLKRKKEKAYTDSNYDLLYRTCVEMGQLFLDNEDYKSALKEYKEAEQAGELGNVTIQIAKAKRMIGEVYILLEQPTNAINNVLQYLELSRSENDLKEEQRALATLARIYFIQAELLEVPSKRIAALTEAEEYNIKSLQVCERLKETTNQKDVADMKARVYLNLGLVMEAWGNTDKAVTYLEKAVAICKTWDLWDDLCLSYTNLGIAYKRAGNTANALKAFDLGVSVAVRLSEKAKLTCDILVHKADVLFELPDFRGAKHALHKAYKLRTPEDVTHTEIQRKLKIVATMCKLEERLVHLDEENVLEKRNTYELMGDGCIEMESYKKAVEYYELTLKCAKELGESGKRLAEIYVSLAQTYKDLKQFDKALVYYQQEYMIWKNNPAEACNTSINIADILDAKGAPTIEVVTSFKSARALAKDAKDVKLELSVLKEFVHYLQRVEETTILPALLEELDKLKNKLGNDMSEESGNESDGETATGKIGEDICLDTLTDSELDDEDSSSKPRSTRHSNKTFNFRRNEKGETPLHTACINGNLSLVQRLLDQGHPIDVRDNNGWLPLHEAANFGYVDIVRELVERGATINDRGGPSCGGITPLLDAASCGHLAVMQLLLDKGASPTMRTNKGETVFDLLKEWRARYNIEEHEDLDSETLGQYKAMVQKIKAVIEKAGHTVSKTPGASTSRNTSRESRVNTARFSGEKTRFEDKRKSANAGLRKSFEDNDDGSGSKLIQRRHSGDAVSEYEEAIRGVKHRPIRKEVPVSPLKESQGPLVMPDAVVDDWLIDDMKGNDDTRPAKRKRKNEFLGTQQRNRDQENFMIAPHPTKVLRRISSSETECKQTDDDMKGRKSSVVDNDLDSNSSPRIEFGNDDNSSESLAANENNSTEPSVDSEEFKTSKYLTNAQRNCDFQKRQTTLTANGFSRQQISSEVQMELSDHFSLPGSSNTNTTQKEVAKIRTMKVFVEGKSLLIVLPNNHSELKMSWLAEETARRYRSAEGMEPKLSLKSVEGAFLSPDDPLCLIFDLGSEIHATVTSWNVIPIPQVYKDACRNENIDVNLKVNKQLDACQASSSFILKDCVLTATECGPMFKALSRYHSIQHIRLSGVGLGDMELKLLIDCLPQFQSLRELDISCNTITSDGFLSMCQHASQNGGFQNLEVLNVSFNPLGDCMQSLKILMSSATSLHTLQMSSVSLSSFTAAEFSLDSIEDLDMSYNKIGQEGTKSLLSVLNVDRICSLNLAAVGKYAVREVAMFLSQSIPYNLNHLSLAYCDIDNCDMLLLHKSLKLCPQLQKLNIAGKNNLSDSTVNLMLQLPLTDLNLAGVIRNQAIVTSIKNLYISSNTKWGDSGPFSFSCNNISSIISN